MGQKKTPVERFYESITVLESGCWQWRDYSGAYGQFSVDGEHWPAHRWSYQQFVGELIPGMHICHKCDVKECVNPAHLEQETPQKNTQDAYDRGLAHGLVKTHCSKGHPFPEGEGQRHKCRICRAAWNRSEVSKAKRRQRNPRYRKQASCDLCGKEMLQLSIWGHLKFQHGVTSAAIRSEVK